MAQDSRIEWTHHTFNPWWGCTKVSPACDNCYAEAWAKRTGHSVWGAKTPRRFLSDFYWRQPILWNREAERKGLRARVFCASMADVFEWRGDLKPWRKRLWALIEDTPNLNWLLLTKRPHLVSRLSPWGDNWPDNVWLGATVESQKFAEKRIHHLIDAPAKTRFLSCEPLLTSLDLTAYLADQQIHWVIAGGESGANAVPSDPEWFRALRDQCVDHSVAFHFKQWGEWAPMTGDSQRRVRVLHDGMSTTMARYGKKHAGRTLDGREWNEYPDSYFSEAKPAAAVIS